MKNEEVKESSNKELLELAKQKKTTAVINALLIGFLIGIIIYGVAKNNLSFFVLIPLIIVYKLFNKPKKK
jgi:membrane protein YdbS with pleckstrin-like domain